jgi:hypothetical protein
MTELARSDPAPSALTAWPGILVAVPPIILLTALAITWAHILPLREAMPLLGASVACALPGVLISRRLYDGSPSPWITALLVGPAWGYALSSLVLLGLWLLGVKDARALFGGAAAAMVCGMAAARPLQGILRAPAMNRRDVVAVCLLLTLVPLIVGRPFARVGEDSPEGQRWRAYFTADFVWAMAVVSEVSKGEVPPQNPYRLGDSLHYYWLAHLVPALEHRLTASRLEVRQVLLANAVLSGLLFLAFLYAFARQFTTSPAAGGLACAFVLFCHSFEGIEQLATLWSWGAPIGLVQYMNIDAVTRWVYKGMPVDGLQRLLLYQPQHQIGYVLGVSALLALVQARERLRIRLMALVGSALGVALLISTFSALMVTVMACVFLGIDVVRRRAWVAGVFCAVAATVPLLGAVALANALEYVEHGGSLVTVTVNRLAIHRWPLMLFLSFGGVAMVAALGAWLAFRARVASRLAIVGIMIATSMAFYFFVDVRDHQNVYVGWRAGHLLFIAGVPLVVVAFEQIWRLSRWARVGAVVFVVFVALLAVPTTAIDLYNTQDVSNRGSAPGFRWTMILSPDELDALRWIRKATPVSSVVQVEPFLRDSETWAFIPAFAERRMAAGLPISMIPIGKYERASERVRRLYGQTSAEMAYEMATHLGIDYLVIAPIEAAAYPHLAETLDASPFRWRLAYSNPTVRIYASSR